jgi:hypothetical protein
LLKNIKEHLEARFVVAADRADLYAYFFELGLRLLKSGGRLGFISSSTFFRTRSGAPLRTHLAQHAHIESVVDFGDLQVFEGVTTYPAIVILRKNGTAEPGTLRYLNARGLPDDLSRVFKEQAFTMPRSRLGSATWRFESDLLDTIRSKMAAGRNTLEESYGSPLYGIKTGLNAAFVVTRAQRDAMIARDPRSAAIIKPFLIGENLKRWHIESDDLWLIYTPKNHIDIEDYPAVRDHLMPWRERLENRATKQNWWELQQAQAAYADHFFQQKVVFERFQSRPTFAFDGEGRLPNNALWCVQNAGMSVLALLNSRLFEFFIRSVTTPLAGGYYQIQAHQINQMPIPVFGNDESHLSGLAKSASELSGQLAALRHAGRNRLSDLSPSIRSIEAFLDWPSLTFGELQALLKRRCKYVIAVTERDEWETWFTDRKAEAIKLASDISAAEAEINQRIYRLFDLTPTEISAIEDALAIASPALNLAGYEAISAVEGLELSDEARRRLTDEHAAA